jgi:hypothetical protein
MSNTELAKRFLALFTGLDRAYGVYATAKRKGAEGEKVKGRALTELKPVTIEVWEKHLRGEQGLGIIPIRDDNTVLWGAIDIDKYDGLDLIALEKKLVQLMLPLVVFRSKSGGAHLILFCAEPISAKYIRTKLNEWAVLIGHKGVEIFPKQDVLRGPEDVGNWLNMPYFNGETTTDRYAVYDGQSLSAEDFLTFAEKRRITHAGLQAFTVDTDTYFANGPPCLQHLVKVGFHRGHRNYALFNLGVLTRMADGDDWRQRVEEFNHRFIDPPLPSSEVANTIKSLQRKKYFYQCNMEPIVSVCNKDICRTRKFGIGQSDVPTAIIDSITKYTSDPPTYLVEIEGVEVACSAADLMSQAKFKVMVLEKADLIIVNVKQDIWEQMVREKLKTMKVIEAPVDSGPEGQLLNHLESFCTGRVTATSIDEILLGKPYIGENGHTYFRSIDLFRYLETNKFRDYSERQIWAILRRRGCTYESRFLKGKTTIIWTIPSFTTQKEDFDIPPVEGSDL